MNELALFAGAGGGILGGHLLGWRTVCAVEFAEYPRRVLLARQRDGLLPVFPIWDDVRTFDGKPWRGRCDVVSGGFPCQDISVAGTGDGLDGERSGLWLEMARIICEVRPRFAFVENSPALTSRGLGTVLGDLAEMGFDAKWGVFSAADVGARHLRERIWIVAHSVQNGRDEGLLQDHDGTEGTRRESPKWGQDWVKPDVVSAIGRSLDEGWMAEPEYARAFDDMATVVDRLAATGNGQVPAVAAMAWRILTPNVAVSGRPAPRKGARAMSDQEQAAAATPHGGASVLTGGLDGLLAPKHTGTKISAEGILGRIRDGRHYKELNYGCGVMLGHLEEMAERFYSGDVKAVDEFMQLYCLDDHRPETPNVELTGLARFHAQGPESEANEVERRVSHNADEPDGSQQGA